MKIIFRSAWQTQKFAADLAKKISRHKVGTPTEALVFNARVIALVGDLGAGKTTFAQGFAKGLGIKQRMVSPTFLIMRKYQISKSKFQNFYHVDVYRIHHPGELNILKFKDILRDPRNLVLIEWAERIKKILPPNTIWIKLQHKKENERAIEIKTP